MSYNGKEFWEAIQKVDETDTELGMVFRWGFIKIHDLQREIIKKDKALAELQAKYDEAMPTVNIVKMTDVVS